MAAPRKKHGALRGSSSDGCGAALAPARGASTEVPEALSGIQASEDGRRPSAARLRVSREA